MLVLHEICWQTYLMNTSSHGTTTSVECGAFFELILPSLGFGGNSTTLCIALFWNWINNCPSIQWISQKRGIKNLSTYRAILVQLLCGLYRVALNQPVCVRKTNFRTLIFSQEKLKKINIFLVLIKIVCVVYFIWRKMHAI